MAMTEDDVKRLFETQLASFLSCVKDSYIRGNLKTTFEEWTKGDTTRSKEGPPRPGYDMMKTSDWKRFCAMLEHEEGYTVESYGTVPGFKIERPWGTLSGCIHDVYQDNGDDGRRRSLGLSLLVSAWGPDGNQSEPALAQAVKLLRRAGFGIGPPRLSSVHVYL